MVIGGGGGGGGHEESNPREGWTDGCMNESGGIIPGWLNLSPNKSRTRPQLKIMADGLGKGGKGGGAKRDLGGRVEETSAPKGTVTCTLLCGLFSSKYLPCHSACVPGVSWATAGWAGRGGRMLFPVIMRQHWLLNN